MLVIVFLSACGGSPTKKAVVIAPTITEFTASSISITTGDTVTLNWMVRGTNPAISITSLGDVTGTSATISPTETTAYTLTAKNSAGEVTKDLKVTVNSTKAKSLISDLDSVIVNSHSSFSQNSAEISFYIDFQKDVQIDTIKSIKITTALDPDNFWLLETEYIKDNIYTFSDSQKGVAIEGLYDTLLAENSSLVSLGDYNFLITLENSDTIAYTHNVPAPGSNGTNGKNYGYSEDYPNVSNPLSDYVSLLKRAQITSATLDDSASRLTFEFIINDARAYNGIMWMYDENDAYIGKLKDVLRDVETGTISQYLNSGTAFNTDGTANKVAVEAPQVIFEQGKSFKDIDQIAVSLSDGIQYKGTSNVFELDHKSISALQSVEAGPSQ